MNKFLILMSALILSHNVDAHTVSCVADNIQVTPASQLNETNRTYASTLASNKTFRVNFRTQGYGTTPYDPRVFTAAQLMDMSHYFAEGTFYALSPKTAIDFNTGAFSFTGNTNPNHYPGGWQMTFERASWLAPGKIVFYGASRPAGTPREVLMRATMKCTSGREI